MRLRKANRAPVLLSQESSARRQVDLRYPFSVDDLNDVRVDFEAVYARVHGRSPEECFVGLGCGQALTDELFERLRAPRLELGGFAQGSRRQLRRFHPGIWDLDADPRSRGVMLLVATQVLDDCGCATSLAVAMGPTAPARAFADWFEERTIRSGLPRFEHSWEDTIQ